jgi:cysteinyl-tRNA synthetase
MQSDLKEQFELFKNNVAGLEAKLIDANSSVSLGSIFKKMTNFHAKYLEGFKTKLRFYRTRLDEQLTNLRSSNALFRISLNSFAQGGNFSTEELETYKKRLERLADLIDKNETSLLRELEKLEKSHLEELNKLNLSMNEKHQNNLLELKFIETNARWLADVRIKIKGKVNESNAKAEKLVELFNRIKFCIDCCLQPHPDKKVFDFV